MSTAVAAAIPLARPGPARDVGLVRCGGRTTCFRGSGGVRTFRQFVRRADASELHVQVDAE